MKVEVLGFHALIKIKINGLIHLQIVRDDLFIFQSWKVDDTLFAIEFVSKTGAKTLAEYDDFLVWSEILKGLDALQYST